MSAGRHPRLGVQLPRTHRHSAYATFAAVALSGVAWFVLHDLFPGDRSATLHALLVTHGIAAAISLVAVGSLLPVHVRLAWRTQRNRVSGIASLAIVGGLALTGLLLYYGAEDSRDVARWSHIGAGLAVVAALPLHVWLGRRFAPAHAGARVRTDRARARRDASGVDHAETGPTSAG